MSRHHAKAGRPYRRARALVLGQSDLCGLCLHPGATETDHIIPVSLGGTHDVSNLRPAHGASRPCPTCGRKCNQERSNSLSTATVRPAPTRRWR